jgi:para-nitrobenzyl esterase
MTDLAAPGIVRHLGIRYATAARFAAPTMERFDPAAGPFDAAGPLSPQVPGMVERLLGVTSDSMSEDCLYLNVFAPEGADADSKLPVLYWIHGGAYANGGGSVPWYDGAHLAARGHVVVTINYRLGAFGFLGEGNWGTLDQICGLQWVREHIAGFGGDAGNVTIFGESAGGSAVVSLLAAPDAQGLFHRAWAMSPSISQLRSLEQAQSWAVAFFEKAGVADLDEARTLPLDKVLEAQAAVLTMPSSGYEMFTPAAGGLGLPVDVLDSAAANPVPLSIGTNRDENLLFLAFDPAYSTADETKWHDHARHQFGTRAEEARAAYEAARPGASPLGLIAAAQTDHVFRRPAQRLAEARVAAGNATWMYWFTWASPAFGGILGSAHALDIPFAFDNLHLQGIEMLLGGGPELQAIATRFADEISSFSVKGAPSWEPFDTTERATLRIDATVELLHDPEPELRALDA